MYFNFFTLLITHRTNMHISCRYFVPSFSLFPLKQHVHFFCSSFRVAVRICPSVYHMNHVGVAHERCAFHSLSCRVSFAKIEDDMPRYFSPVQDVFPIRHQTCHQRNLQYNRPPTFAVLLSFILIYNTYLLSYSFQFFMCIVMIASNLLIYIYIYNVLSLTIGYICIRLQLYIVV